MNHQYIVVTMTPPSRRTRYFVGKQGIGGEAFHAIAETYIEDYAKRIAAAMNHERLALAAEKSVPAQIIPARKRRA